MQDRVLSFSSSLLSDTKFYSGSLQSDQQSPALQRYLLGAKFLILQTKPNLLLAARESQRRNLGDLSNYFIEKISEEEGHEQWAEEDLLYLKKRTQLPDFEYTSDALEQMMAIVRDAITEEPRLYLAYIYLAEAITVQVGSVWIPEGTRAGHFRSDEVSVIAKHVVLDQDHVRENLQAMGYWLKEEGLTGPAQRFVEQCLSLYWRFITSLDANVPTR